MRATLVSLIALSLAAPAAFAQMPATTPAPNPAAPAPATAAPIAPTPAPAEPMATPAPTGAAPSTGTAPGVAPVEPAAPPGPPPAPTDPTAIALISTLENICVPAVAGGKMDKLAKAGGYRKSGENYVMKGKGFQLTVLAPGSNPQTCHVDIVSPVDPEAPAKPLVVALHNWAAVSRGYTLYRNDKNVANSQELTTRSWEHSEQPGKDDALVLTTFRKADGAPSGGHETSQMLFSTNGTAPS